jgi:hypothetical protein
MRLDCPTPGHNTGRSSRVYKLWPLLIIVIILLDNSGHVAKLVTSYENTLEEQFHTMEQADAFDEFINILIAYSIFEISKQASHQMRTILSSSSVNFSLAFPAYQALNWQFVRSRLYLSVRTVESVFTLCCGVDRY